MSKLHQLVAGQIDSDLAHVTPWIGGVSESLNDILMYLDENEDMLPHKSEVAIAELFILVRGSIADIDKAVVSIAKASKWLKALGEQN